MTQTLRTAPGGVADSAAPPAEDKTVIRPVLGYEDRLGMIADRNPIVARHLARMSRTPT